MDTALLPEPAPSHLRPSRFSHLILQTPQFEETGAFDRNFVGVPFDPEHLVERHRERADEDELLKKELYR